MRVPCVSSGRQDHQHKTRAFNRSRARNLVRTSRFTVTVRCFGSRCWRRSASGGGCVYPPGMSPHGMSPKGSRRCHFASIPAGGCERSIARSKRQSAGPGTEFHQTCPDTAVAEDATLSAPSDWCGTTASLTILSSTTPSAGGLAR